MSAINGSDPIQVVLAADANYVIPLAVAICSVAMNCDRDRRLVFNVIQSGIGHDLRSKVRDSLKRTRFPNAQINWLDAPLERLDTFKLGHSYTTCLTFARLLIPELLPVKVQKVLYLDCDIAVNDNIGELWDSDFGGKSLLAARDSIGFVSDPCGLSNFHELGISPDAHYFNAGVLLINLEKWRTDRISEQLFSYLRAHRTIIQMADQEALNAVLWNDWGELDYRWNWQIIWRKFRAGKAERIWVPETSHKSVVHFITAEKPWLPGCDYDEKKYFFQYLDQTAWAGLRVPWWREIYGRSQRTLGEARNTFGRLRRHIMAR